MPKLNNPNDLLSVIEQSKQKYQIQKSQNLIITIGMGTCGLAAGAGETYTAIIRELANHHIEATIHQVGCIGMCVMEPLVDIQLAGGQRISYSNINPSKVPRLIEEHIIKGAVVQDWVVGYVPNEW